MVTAVKGLIVLMAYVKKKWWLPCFAQQYAAGCEALGHNTEVAGEEFDEDVLTVLFCSNEA